MKKRWLVHFQRWSARYQCLAVLVCNTAIILLLLNTILGMAYTHFDHRQDKPPGKIRAYKKYGEALVRGAYPEHSAKEVDRILMERDQIRYEFQPFSQFREKATSGHHLNVSKHGFREIKNQRDWPPDRSFFNVFVFGGSTTFGYSISDNETIPSHLQAELEAKIGPKIAVYNFGRAYFYSRLESALFQEFIMAGHQIDLAIFIDGLNEFAPHAQTATPPFTAQLERLMREAQSGDTSWMQQTRLPLLRFARFVQATFTRKPATTTAPLQVEASDHNQAISKRCVQKYLRSKKMIEAVAQVFSVPLLFVWQPIPMFAPGAEGNPFAKGGAEDEIRVEGYRHMLENWESDLLGSDFVWCGHLNQRTPPPRYVDRVHYSGQMCRQIALNITQAIMERDLVTLHPAQE